ncbi:MAG: hypothetical protein KJO34_10135, partial [Deltaproteobacteria bacterium]|nr:hypothetical protein [Deltaproteobacteria bacterium]
MNKSRTGNANIVADTEAHPKKWSGWLVIVISLAGLSICLYLFSLHVDLLKGEIKSGLLCGAANNGFGCQWHPAASAAYLDFRSQRGVLYFITYW